MAQDKSESEAEGRLVDEQLSRVLLTPDYCHRADGR
jgi:hypothetical protein